MSAVYRNRLSPGSRRSGILGIVAGASGDLYGFMYFHDTPTAKYFIKIPSGAIDTYTITGTTPIGFYASQLIAAPGSDSIYGVAYDHYESPPRQFTIFQLSGGTFHAETTIAAEGVSIAPDDGGNVYAAISKSAEFPEGGLRMYHGGSYETLADFATTENRFPTSLLYDDVQALHGLSTSDTGTTPTIFEYRRITEQPAAEVTNGTIREGGSLSLSGSGTPGNGANSITKYEWDLNYDGTHFTVDSQSRTPSFSAAGLDGPLVRTVALRVTDSQNRVSAIAVGTVTITNGAPTAVLSVTPGSAGTATFAKFSSVADSAADLAAGLKYSFDFNNDGDFTDSGDVSGSTSATAQAVYARAGVFVIRARVTDKDGGFSDYTKSFTIGGASTTASIAGLTFKDANADGIRQSAEAGESGKTIFLDADNDGVLDPAEAKVTSGSDGSFALTGLVAGTYHVRRVFAAGYTASTPVIDRTLASGQAVTGLTIGSKGAAAPVNTASISGFAFNDANRDGVFNSGDTLAAGKTVWLDLDDDGVIDSGEASVVTDSAGKFAFANLAARTYHVRRVFPAGYVESTPARQITLTSGQAVSGVSIGSKN